MAILTIIWRCAQPVGALRVLRSGRVPGLLLLDSKESQVGWLTDLLPGHPFAAAQTSLKQSI